MAKVNSFAAPILMEGDVDDHLPVERGMQYGDLNEFPLDPPSYKFTINPNEKPEKDKSKDCIDSFLVRLEVNSISLSCQLYGGNDFLPESKKEDAGKVSSGQPADMKYFTREERRLKGGVGRYHF